MSDKNNTFIDLTKRKVKEWGSRIVIDIPDKANLMGKILRIGLKGKNISKCKLESRSIKLV